MRVDTQTILTIDDTVITRSQRFAVRHMTDASAEYSSAARHRAAATPAPAHQHGHHHHHQKGNGSAPGMSPRTAIHKTWQLIIRDVQSSDAGLYVIIISFIIFTFPLALIL